MTKSVLELASWHFRVCMKVSYLGFPLRRGNRPSTHYAPSVLAPRSMPRLSSIAHVDEGYCFRTRLDPFFNCSNSPGHDFHLRAVFRTARGPSATAPLIARVFSRTAGASIYSSRWLPHMKPPSPLRHLGPSCYGDQKHRDSIACSLRVMDGIDYAMQHLSSLIGFIFLYTV